MKEKLLLIGYRGYGDWFFASPALPYLFSKYDIHLETNMRGMDIFNDDERFTGKTYFDVDEVYHAIQQGQPIREMDVVNERWDAVKKEVKPDRVINLISTLESVCVAEAYQDTFWGDLQARRDTFGKEKWREQIFKVLDIEMPEKLEHGLYFRQKNIEWSQRWKKKHEGQKIIMMAMSGSGFHKKYPDMEKLVFHILDKYKDTVIYNIGGQKDKIKWNHKRLYDTAGISPYKQSLLMLKNSDLVIGPETGAHVAAGLFGIPKIQFCNMSSIEQLCGMDKGDMSVQSKAPCSPCHKMVKNVFHCDNATIEDYKLVPSCTVEYDWDEITSNVEGVLN